MNKKYIITAITLFLISSCKEASKSDNLTAAKNTNLDYGIDFNINLQGKVATGLNYTIIVKNDCSAWSFGVNNTGQLGLGNENQSTIPAKINKNNEFCAIKASAGFEHALILDSSGNIYGFGNNQTKAVSNVNPSISIKSPFKIDILGNDNTSMSAGGDYYSGYYSLVLKKNGSIWGFGSNKYGQLGTDNTIDITAPKELTLLGTDNKEISTGGGHTLILKKDGTVWSVGNNKYGQLGLGDFIERHKPSKITDISNVVMISAGEYHSVAMTKDGYVYTFGRNNNGQLGLNRDTDIDSPFPYPPFDMSVNRYIDGRYINAGYNSTLILSNNNRLLAFGTNKNGNLGIGQLQESIQLRFPLAIFNASNDNVAMSIGGAGVIKNNNNYDISDNFTILLKSNGSYWSYGNNDKGQLGLGHTMATQLPFPIQFK